MVLKNFGIVNNMVLQHINCKHYCVKYIVNFMVLKHICCQLCGVDTFH